MSKIPFDKNEAAGNEFFPALPGLYGMRPFPTRKLNTPITPKENFRRFMEGEKPMWIPNMGTDFQTIQPLVMPDANARVNGGIDWFGIDWEYEPKSNAAMVRPGTKRLSEVSAWEEELIWPDLSAIDWKKDREENYGGLSDEAVINFVIVNGLYERLADMTSFEDTLCAFVDEDEVEYVHTLFDKLTDFHLELMKIAKEVYGATVITFHDDMGTQRSSFFSPETFREVMLPHYQKMNKAAHEMGLYVMFHSCGNVGNLLPLYIEAGFDLWEGQDSSNDKPALSAVYSKDLPMEFMILNPTLDDAAMDAVIDDFVSRAKNGQRNLLWMTGSPACSYDAVAKLYEVSRKMYLED